MDKFNEHNKNLKISFIMKRIKLEKLFALGIIFLLLTSTFLFFVPEIEAQNRFSGKGSGTPDDPYIITNVKQLQEMKYDLKAHYVLGNDIDASETKNWNNGQGFEPIGDKDNPFTGSFDGRGYKIYNLYINTTRDFVGLFGYVGKEGIIKNVGLENVKISSTGYDVGGLIGHNDGTVSNCYSTGSVNGQDFVGGLVGGNGGTVGTVSNCYSTGSVNGQDFVGGLVGFNGGTVSNCYSTGSVNGRGVVGGLIGWNSGKVSNCYSTGSVNGRGVVGGLIGVNHETVSNSYSTGSVNGQDFVGGLIGTNNGKVSNCYSTGSVNGQDEVGGLIGTNNGKVSNCYSTGSVNGEGGVGGLIGYNYFGTVSNSYSTGSVNGYDGVGGLIGYNDGTVSNSYSIGSVKGNSYVGGLIGGNDGKVSNCYSTGSVNGNANVGGLIGYNKGTVSNSFWDIQTSGLEKSDGGTGKTTEEMKNVRTYTDVKWSKGLDSPWDFVGNPYDDKGNEDIWDIKPNINNGYPYLTTIKRNIEVKFKGEVTDVAEAIDFAGTPLAGIYYIVTVKVSDVLEDPTGNLKVGMITYVTFSKDFPNVDKVKVGDLVEVYGTFKGIKDKIVNIQLEDIKHYLKLISSSMTLYLNSNLNHMQILGVYTEEDFPLWVWVGTHSKGHFRLNVYLPPEIKNGDLSRELWLENMDSSIQTFSLTGNVGLSSKQVALKYELVDLDRKINEALGSSLTIIGKGLKGLHVFLLELITSGLELGELGTFPTIFHSLYPDAYSLSLITTDLVKSKGWDKIDDKYQRAKEIISYIQENLIYKLNEAPIVDISRDLGPNHKYKGIEKINTLFGGLAMRAGLDIRFVVGLLDRYEPKWLYYTWTEVKIGDEWVHADPLLGILGNEIYQGKLWSQLFWEPLIPLNSRADPALGVWVKGQWKHTNMEKTVYEETSSVSTTIPKSLPAYALITPSVKG
jgi:hypothetical protein